MTQVDPAYKQAALQALAQGGTAAKTQLDQTKAQMDAAKAAMTGQALSQAAALNAPTGAGEALSKIISQPYDTASTALAAKLGARQTSQAALAGPTAAVFDTRGIVNETKGSGSGRGSGGGGGRGGSPKAENWWKQLSDTFGTKATLQKWIGQQAPGFKKYKDYGAANQQATQMGVPQEVADVWFPATEAQTAYSKLQDAARQGTSVSQVRKKLQQVYQNADNGAITYWTQVYRQLSNQPRKK